MESVILYCSSGLSQCCIPFVSDNVMILPQFRFRRRTDRQWMLTLMFASFELLYLLRIECEDPEDGLDSCVDDGFELQLSISVVRVKA